MKLEFVCQCVGGIAANLFVNVLDCKLNQTGKGRISMLLAVIDLPLEEFKSH